MALKYCTVLVFVVLCFLTRIFAIEDYCSVNTFKTDEGRMQFTKEPSYDEYALVGKFKGLHCCAKGYRSIEWFKDGKPYPWPGMVSQLILYPESANQTVYTQNVALEDSGNYTCLLKHDSLVYSHTIRLKVYENTPDDPKITYVSGNTQAALGDSIRLFCEAFVGTVDLPDAHNEAEWSRMDYNGTLDDYIRVWQEKVSREDNQTTGTYLNINEVQKDDFGEYICTINKPEGSIVQRMYLTEKVKVEYLNPNPFPWKGVLIVTSILSLVLLSTFVLYRRFGLPLRVKIKDSFGNLETEDGKSNDVLIVYSSKDSEIVTGVLIPILESKYFYKCASRELPNNISIWHTDLAAASEKTRRLLAVLSPSTFGEQWETGLIFQGVKQLQMLGVRLTCIVLKPLPSGNEDPKNSEGENLTSLLRSMTMINWERCQDERFWYSLRLRLPAKRAFNRVDDVEKSENPKRLSNDSQESLDNLV